MALNIPSGYGQARFLFQLAGRPDPYVVTWGCLCPVANTPNEAALGIRVAFTGTGGPYTAARMASGYTFLGVDVTQETPSGPQLGSSRLSVAGSMTTNTLPPNSAMLIKKFTTMGGRRGRGRAFIPPLHFLESDVDQVGNIAAGNVSLIEGYYNAALTLWEATIFKPYLFHEEPEGAGGTYAPSHITSISISGLLATQRRRLR